MSILIRGMEMPKNCCECPVNLYVCQRGYEYLLEHPELYDQRADDCPISYVPADVVPVVRCGECKHWKRIRNDCILASCELDALVRSEFDLQPCEKCGGEGVERIGEGFERFLCGIPVGHSFGTYICCRKCGHRTDAYDEPWKAIRTWNHQPMKQFLEE